MKPKSLFRLWLSLILALSASGSSASDTSGREFFIAGSIVNPNGEVVQNASVAAIPTTEGGVTGQLGTAGSLHWISSDEQGRFKLWVSHGTYEIRAKDERNGYPDPMFLLSADPSARFPTIKVENSNIEGVRVILPKQGGLLRIAIRDQDTGRPISGAKAIVQDSHNKEIFVELGANEEGNIEFAVPHKPLIITAEAGGYSKSAFHEGEQVELSDGDHKEITIQLKRRK